MEQLKLAKKHQAAGVVHLPGSKSVSNRALLLAALSQGTTHITNLLKSDDTERMLDALKALGIETKLSADGTVCDVVGNNGRFKSDKVLSLFLGNAGTAMRPLVAALALSQGTFELTGVARMEERPVGPLVEALKSLGAEISYLKKDGYPPLKITGKNLKGGVAEIDGTVSSQFITAFLMAAPLMEGDVKLKIRGDLISKPYIDITIALMKRFGVTVKNDEYREFTVLGGQRYLSPKNFLVEGDASGATYFLAAGAIAGEVKVTGIGRDSIQGDVTFTKVLEAMGAKVDIKEDSITCSKAPLHGIDMDMNNIPDAAMTAVPLAVFAEGSTTIRNIGSWRVKETDRISAMATELKKLGVGVEEGQDYLKIIPAPVNIGIAIDTYNDHRMAMCFSLISFMTDVIINDPKCVAKTFPEYFDRFSEIAS